MIKKNIYIIICHKTMSTLSILRRIKSSRAQVHVCVYWRSAEGCLATTPDRSVPFTPVLPLIFVFESIVLRAGYHGFYFARTARSYVLNFQTLSVRWRRMGARVFHPYWTGRRVLRFSVNAFVANVDCLVSLMRIKFNVNLK